jgi:hypothetical protein
MRGNCLDVEDGEFCLATVSAFFRGLGACRFDQPLSDFEAGRFGSYVGQAGDLMGSDKLDQDASATAGLHSDIFLTGREASGSAAQSRSHTLDGAAHQWPDFAPVNLHQRGVRVF